MWDVIGEANLFLITTNARVNSQGNLVMGRGIALEATQRYPAIAKAWGSRLIKMGRPREYNLLLPDGWTEMRLQRGFGAFQVKYSWELPADLGLIERSTLKLAALATAHPNAQIHLNYPGIGNGRRTVDEVSPILAALPNNVTVWRYNV